MQKLMVSQISLDMMGFRKLPVWGKGVDHVPINFEWPNPEQFV